MTGFIISLWIFFVLFDTKAMKELRQDKINDREIGLQSDFEQIKSFICSCETMKQRRTCWKMIGKFRSKHRDMKHTIILCNIWWEMSEAPQFLEPIS